MPGTCPGTGACAFAPDPALSALETAVAWRAEVCASVLPLSTAPTEFTEAVTLEELARRASGRLGKELLLGKAGSAFQLTIHGEASGGAALLLPLDADLPARLDAAERLWRWLSAGTAEPPDTPTVQQRERLVEQLRALDARRDDASIREIAAGLFGEDRLPDGRDWRAHDLRNRTRRLIDGGLKLMRGGYHALLHGATPRGSRRG